VPIRRPEPHEIRVALVFSATLGLSCLLTYWLATEALSRVHSVSHQDDLLGGMWAVVATIFVYRLSYSDSTGAAVSRMAASAVSLALCLAYLALFASHGWSVALLVGLSVLAVLLLGRQDDAVTAAITATVVMVIAIIEPHDAWEQPILRFMDTAIGVVIGVAAAWLGVRLTRRLTGAPAS
jgi:uncharacterized membrane protein YccC